MWCDLETTGLDPVTCDILEVAFAVVKFDRPFDNVIGGSLVLRHQQWSNVERRVLEMHTKSGLVNECLLSEHTLNEVERIIIDNLDGAPCVVLAGSSVHFDLGFIRAKMPLVAALLHYRVYDVSAVRNFAYSLGMPEMPHVESAHRARQDIEASVTLGKHLAAWFGKETR